MKISKKELEQIIKEEIEATLTEEFGDDSPFRMRDMVPPTVRGKFKDTFTKVPGAEGSLGRGKPSPRAKAAWEAAGGELSIFDKEAIAKFLEDAGLKISLEDYVDNINYAVKGDRLGRRIYSLVDALALANRTGSRRGHPKTAKDKAHKAPQFTRESIVQKIIKEEIEQTEDLMNAIRDLTQAIEELDISVDYMASAMTGDDPLAIGSQQRRIGRAARPKSPSVPAPRDVAEKKLSEPEKKEKEKVVKGMKKNKKDFKKRYGDDAESVMYATATKIAKEKK